MRILRRTIGLGSVTALVALGGMLAAPASATTVACGATIKVSVTLTADLGPCAGNGIIAAANNITINLGGHTLFGSDAHGGDTAGVRMPNRTEVRVTNGTITGFDAGIAVFGGKRNTVQQLRIHDNIGVTTGDLGDGVFISNSKSNLVQGNVIKHNGPFEGVGVFGNASAVVLTGVSQVTTGNRIQGNDIENNNSLSDPFNLGELISTDVGINLGSGIDGGSFTTVANNVIRANGREGVLACAFGGSACFTTNNTIVENVVEGNGEGRPVGDGINVTGIVAVPGQPPSSALSPPTHDLIANNVSRNNSGSGINVSNSSNQILDNVALGNGTGGSRRSFDLNGSAFPFLPNCNNNLWFGNTYGTAIPDCVTAGGHQVSSPSSTAGGAEQAAAASPSSEVLSSLPVERHAPAG